MSVLTAVLGAVMVASSLGVKLIGLPRQLLVNRKRKTAPHAMRWFAVLGTLSYGSQAAWCFLAGDWLPGALAAPGALVTMICLWQVLRYTDAG